MRIGIDISQMAYEGTGVANFVKNLVETLITQDRDNDYILFYSSFRKGLPFSKLWSSGSQIKINSQYLRSGKGSIQIAQFKLPPSLLDLLWNRWHILPIEKFIGDVDIFISSDWTQPPTRKAKKVTILYDLIVYKFPEETHNQWQFNLKNLLISPNIVVAQKRRLAWVKKECDKIICISESTKKDAMHILKIPEKKLSVVYPGI
jgi:glycosyltransferase involved in cell wall biosynthesis